MAKKELKSIEIHVIGCSEVAPITASDTAQNPIASYALADFKAENYMDIKKDDGEYFVPFHAVDLIVVTSAQTEVADRPNPYGCEAGDGTCVAKACVAKVGC